MKKQLRRPLVIGLVIMAGLLGLACLVWSHQQPKKATAAGTSLLVRPQKSTGLVSFFQSVFPTGEKSSMTSPPQERKNGIPPQKLPLASPKVLSAYPGVPALAVVKVRGKETRLEMNSAGEFSRVFVETKSTTPIRLTFPQAQPGDAVQIELEDGGQIVESKSSALVAKIDDSKSISFNFRTSRDEGMYRIRIRTGSDFKVMDFWAGEPPHYASAK